MKKRWTAILGAAALTLLVGGAHAQISASGGPLDISADSLEVNDAQRVTTWRGKVEALQGVNRLRSNLLNVYFVSGSGQKTQSAGPGSSWGDIDHLEAVGDVYFVTPQQVARGDRAVYTVNADTIVLTGNVVVAQGENVVRGNRLTIQVSTGQSTMDGSSDQGGRVRGVFYNKK
jgi:lipopolysaccharide export system protein LptA